MVRQGVVCRVKGENSSNNKSNKNKSNNDNNSSKNINSNNNKKKSNYMSLRALHLAPGLPEAPLSVAASFW